MAILALRLGAVMRALGIMLTMVVQGHQRLVACD